MTATDLDRLEGRLDDLAEQVRRLAEFGVSDVRVAELEHRLEQSTARVRVLEERVAALVGMRPRSRAR